MQNACVLCSNPSDTSKSTVHLRNNKEFLKGVLIHKTCPYLPNKEESGVGKARSDAKQLSLHNKRLQMRSSFRVITLRCLLETKLYRPA